MIPVSFPPYEGGEVVLRFVLASDTHITSASPLNQASRRLRSLINLSYAYAATQPYKGLDAVVVAGDLTDNGRLREYEAFKKIMEDEIREETELLTVMGNHGYHDGVMSNYTDTLNPDLHAHAVIKGYHFIGLSCLDGYGTYGAGDLKYMRDGVEAALAADPEKPIITFQHHPVSSHLSGIYAQSSRIVNFYGHTHSPVNHPNAIRQGAFTSFNNGTITYTYLGGGEVPNNIQNAEDANQFCLVEITADHTVRILPFNLHSEDFFHIPCTDRQLVYEFDVNHPETWAYTAEKRAASQAPVFPEGAVITAVQNEGVVSSITFSQAIDDECIYRYQIRIYGSDDSYKVLEYSSGYVVDPLPMTLTVPMRGIMLPGVTYEIEILPYDAFGNRGLPLTAELTA
ncbi:MAG: metallophosphoesterase [Clostridia bacterium]|nr:metallophosphoesterase [Clostridia bacterium]